MNISLFYNQKEKTYGSMAKSNIISSKNKDPFELVYASFKTKLMNPATAFIVVETVEQQK